MENLPCPDFIVSFYNGIRYYQSVSRNVFDFKIPKKLMSSFQFKIPLQNNGEYSIYQRALGSSNCDDIDSAIKDFYIHAQECLKRCLQVSELATKDVKTSYPIIIKSNQSAQATQRPPSPTNSLYGSVNTFSSTIKNIKSPRSIERADIIRPRVKPPFSSLSRNTELRDSFRDSKVSIGNTSTISISQKFTPKHISNIGWCVQTPDRKFCILFGDGVHLIVNPKGLALEYCGDDGSKTSILLIVLK